MISTTTSKALREGYRESKFAFLSMSPMFILCQLPEQYILNTGGFDEVRYCVNWRKVRQQKNRRYVFISIEENKYLKIYLEIA